MNSLKARDARIPGIAGTTSARRGVNLLYKTAEERLSALDPAVVAAFEAKAVGRTW